MLLQTNSYLVPKDKRADHARLMKRFRQTLERFQCEFEVYEQVGTQFSLGKNSGRFVQIMRFRDRDHYQAIQTAERTDKFAQDLIREFCELVNFPYQQEQGLFAVGFYNSVIRPVQLRQAGSTQAGDQGPSAAMAQPAEPEAEPELEAEGEPVAQPEAAPEAGPQDEAWSMLAETGDDESEPMNDDFTILGDQAEDDTLSSMTREEESDRDGSAHG